MIETLPNIYTFRLGKAAYRRIGLLAVLLLPANRVSANLSSHKPRDPLHRSLCADHHLSRYSRIHDWSQYPWGGWSTWLAMPAPWTLEWRAAFMESTLRWGDSDCPGGGGSLWSARISEKRTILALFQRKFFEKRKKNSWHLRKQVVYYILPGHVHL